jgi:pimeloyl-ACP methyl ester carboxylesterase
LDRSSAIRSLCAFGSKATPTGRPRAWPLPSRKTDLTEDLKMIEVPTLVLHSEDDQVVPYANSGPKAAKLLKHGTFKSYKGFPHGMPTTHAEIINADILAFPKA